jgi:hypothetical protein
VLERSRSRSGSFATDSERGARSNADGQTPGQYCSIALISPRAPSKRFLAAATASASAGHGSYRAEQHAGARFRAASSLYEPIEW